MEDACQRVSSDGEADGIESDLDLTRATTKSRTRGILRLGERDRMTIEVEDAFVAER